MFPVITDWDQIYDCNTFLQQLGAYNQSYKSDEFLDLARLVNESDNYIWFGIGFPKIPPGQNLITGNLGPNATINGTEAVPPGSYIVSATAFVSTIGIGNNLFGVKIRLSDKGTKQSIFYGDYCIDNLTFSNMTAGKTPSQLVNKPFGPRYLQSPFIVTPPGNINWEIVNLANASVLAQVFLEVAVPVNNTSLNTRDISK